LIAFHVDASVADELDIHDPGQEPKILCRMAVERPCGLWKGLAEMAAPSCAGGTSGQYILGRISIGYTCGGMEV